MEANNSTFDIKGFLNDPQVQANKSAAMQYLQTKGIVDTQGNLVSQAPTAPTPNPSGATFPAQTPTTGSGGFFKSLVGAPLTMIARPFQAVAELGGASSQKVNDVTSKLTGGLVAPVPENMGDVKKDVGRGIETVALGAGGPVSGGAALGFGSSLEEGNDVFSAKTALNTALGASAGKLLDLVGKPILDATGKVIGKITPQTINDLASKGTKAIQEFAASHNILPEVVSNTINKGAQRAENLANKPFQLLGNAGKATLSGAKAVIQHEYPSLSPTEDAVNKAKENIAGQYEKVLPLTPTQKAKEATLLTKTGDNVYTTLAKHGVNLGSEEAPSQLQDISDQFENAIQHAQQNEHGYFNVDEIRANAHQQIEQNLSSEVARNSAKAKVDGEIEALVNANKGSTIKSANGDRLINSDLVERLRKTGNSWTPFNASDPEKVGRSAGYALSNSVRNQVDKQGTFPAYREANSEWGKIIHAQQVLGDMEASGKTFKVPGGLAGSITRKVLSGVLGYHTAGVGGAVLAEIGSEYGAKILANPELRTYFDRQIIQKSLGEKPTPEIITKLSNQVKEYIDKQGKLLRLPAPSSIQVGPKSSESFVKSVPATKNPVTVNPKTGKFQTSYKSSP